MKICIVSICLLLSNIALASNYEVAPLYDHEMAQSGAKGGAEIGSGAALGADEIFCKDSDPRKCYSNIQRVLTRARAEAKEFFANNNALGARQKLREGASVSANMLGKFFPNDNLLLLTYVSRAVEYNEEFRSGCDLKIGDTTECFNDENKTAYQFLNAYLGIVLNRVHKLDGDFFIPLYFENCDYDNGDTYTRHLNDFLGIQKDILGLVEGVRVGGSDVVVFNSPYYATKITERVISEVNADVQDRELIPMMSAFFRFLPTEDLLASSIALERVLAVRGTSILVPPAELATAKAAVAQFKVDAGNIVYDPSELSRLACKEK